MDQHGERISIFETWWTQDLEGAFLRWVAQDPARPMAATPELLRVFMEQSGLKPRWAQ